MNRKIPIYFDAIILDTPVQELSVSNGSDVGSRLNVAVFTKYRNRNGSYITDEYADYLIASATQGDTPVVGFFDPETQSWASHTGPTLANGYGYVESFIGWEPLTDTDGVTRDYAVFSVVIFTKYYEEAKKIRGQYQSMELDPTTIDGSWANFEGEEYFVYTKGDMLGLCVIGAHEPCFSVSSFFSKNDETYKSQYEKFSLLLSGLKTQVKEAEIIIKGGEQPVDNFELNKETTVEEPIVEEQPAVEEEPVAKPEAEFSANEENESTPEQKEEEKPEAETVTEPSEFEKLQNAYNELENNYNQLKSDYDTLSNTVETLTAANTDFAAQIETLTAEKSTLENSLATYEAQAKEILIEKKNVLIEKYEKVLSAEEISNFREKSNDMTYDELESKLAISFANNKLADNNSDKKVPIPEQQSAFALLMNKYKKK
ncbi:MAG: hypothetical protein J6T10_14030 [Methanobrevibacter sp.]|nr:hypothetical protein [Methanobrevibacter sp.]